VDNGGDAAAVALADLPQGVPKMPRAIRAPLTMAVSRPPMAFAFVRSWQRSLRSSHVVLPAPIEVPQHEIFSISAAPMKPLMPVT
jgi:hypothetical protein